MPTPSLSKSWFSNIRGDSLAGIVVALALISAAIAFSIIAAVDPKVGFYASFCIAIAIVMKLEVRRVGDLGDLQDILTAGVVLLAPPLLLGPWMKQLPLAALVAVMIMVSIDTFSWASFRNLAVHPSNTSMVTIATVVTVA